MQIWDLPSLDVLKQSDVLLVGNSGTQGLCKTTLTSISGETKNIPFTFNSHLTVTVSPSDGNTPYTVSNIPFTVMSVTPTLCLAYSITSGSMTFTSDSANRSPNLAFWPDSPEQLTGIPLFFSWSSYTGLTAGKTPVVTVENNSVNIAERTVYQSDTNGVTSIALATYGNNITIQNPAIAALIFANINDFA